jgi:NADH dehydrogenase [ubiquinone] 1 alpha subcomplex assembly factor 5
MSSSLGGDTLQELRICLNLAEMERDGGVSPNVSPMLSVTDLGNTFAKCNFSMPTVDVTKTTFEFTSAYALWEYLRLTGEQSCLHEGLRPKSIDTFVATASMYKTLFNLRTSPPNLNNSIHVDHFKDWHAEEDPQWDKLPNIIS